MAFDPDNTPEDWEAEAAVMRCLTASSKGEPYDEDELHYASCLMVAESLVRKGVDIDTAAEIVDQAQANGDIRIRWTEADGRLEVTIGDREDADA